MKFLKLGRPYLCFSPDDGLTGGTSPDVVPVTTTVVPPPAGPAKDWEKDYKGLQTTYNVLFAKNTANEQRIQALESENAQLKADKAALEEQVSKAQGELQTAQGTISTEQTAHTNTRQETARLRLILTKFPQLAKFEETGMLPKDGTPEELEAKLTNFAETMKTYIDASTQQVLQGSSIPATHNKPPEVNRDQIMSRMFQITGSNDPKLRAEYQTLQSQLDTLDQK